MPALIQMSAASDSLDRAVRVDLPGMKYFAFYSFVEIVLARSLNKLKEDGQVSRLIDSHDRGPYLDTVPEQFGVLAAAMARESFDQLSDEWLSKCRFNRFEIDFYDSRMIGFVAAIVSLSQECVAAQDKLFFLQDFRMT